MKYKSKLRGIPFKLRIKHDVTGSEFRRSKTFPYIVIREINTVRVALMLPAHFDDDTDDISRLMKANLVRILQELPKSPKYKTRNIKANYEKYRTLNEYSTNREYHI